jgi:hypothetical protein
MYMQSLNVFSPDDAEWSPGCSTSLTTILTTATNLVQLSLQTVVNQQGFDVLVHHGSKLHTLFIHNLEAPESRKDAPCQWKVRHDMDCDNR